ncbi:Hypothetical predicted protein, partial [Mytilus galloprovincialis]
MEIDHTQADDIIIQPKSNLKGLLSPNALIAKDETVKAVFRTDTDTFITLKGGHKFGIGMEIYNVVTDQDDLAEDPEENTLEKSASSKKEGRQSAIESYGISEKNQTYPDPEATFIPDTDASDKTIGNQFVVLRAICNRYKKPLKRAKAELGAIRATENRQTGFTPNFMVFGREIKIFVMGQVVSLMMKEFERCSNWKVCVY